MAVEIKELIIRAVVDYGEPIKQDAATATDFSEEQSKSEIIQACVKQVLQILKQQNKR